MTGIFFRSCLLNDLSYSIKSLNTFDKLKCQKLGQLKKKKSGHKNTFKLILTSNYILGLSLALFDQVPLLLLPTLFLQIALRKNMFLNVGKNTKLKQY